MHAILVKPFTRICRTVSLSHPYIFAAGDFVKFGFPMAYTTTVMAWGLLDYEVGYTSAGMYIVVMVKM
jgi:hypothetical protein